MDAAYISALSALGGATIGGLASFGSSWLTQRTQLRFAHHEAIKAKREALYTEFIDEASRLYGDALGHQKDEVADLVKIYALIGRIRLVSPRPVVTAAERTHEELLPPTRPSAGCGFRKETIAGMRRNGRHGAESGPRRHCGREDRFDS